MSGTIKVDKPCKDCGELMVDVSPSRMYCHNCARKRQREFNAKRQKDHRSNKTGEVHATPIINENAKYCRGCFYWGGHDASACCCNYLLMMGKRRPCPPGKDCTVRKERGRKERQWMNEM